MQAERATSRRHCGAWPEQQSGCQGQGFTRVRWFEWAVAAYQVATFGTSHWIGFGMLGARRVVRLRGPRGLAAGQVWRRNHV